MVKSAASGAGKWLLRGNYGVERGSQGRAQDPAAPRVVARGHPGPVTARARAALVRRLVLKAGKPETGPGAALRCAVASYDPSKLSAAARAPPSSLPTDL